MDADERALEYTHRHMDALAHKASIKLMSDNVIRWLVGRVCYDFGPQDIIYSAGLIDYLDEQSLALLSLNRTYEHLREGGTLIVGNFGS